MALAISSVQHQNYTIIGPDYCCNKCDHKTPTYSNIVDHVREKDCKKIVLRRYDRQKSSRVLNYINCNPGLLQYQVAYALVQFLEKPFFGLVLLVTLRKPP